MLLHPFLSVLSVSDVVASITLLFILTACLLAWVIKVERKMTTLCVKLKGIEDVMKEFKKFHEEHLKTCMVKK